MAETSNHHGLVQKIKKMVMSNGRGDDDDEADYDYKNDDMMIIMIII